MEAIAYLQNRPDTYAGKVGVLGFSRGAELALIIGTLNEAVGPVVSIMGAPRVHGAVNTAEAAWLLQGEQLPFTTIPVETIDGPVLLLHGQEDSLWPVSYTYIVAERLAANNHEYEMIVYPHRGHVLGGGPRDVLNQAVAFLHKHLAP
jgi:dipeptidyl aminopeptidase/acylaminoacyl peptidase